MARLGGWIVMLLPALGCAVGLEPLEAPEREDPSKGSESSTESGPGWGGAAGSDGAAGGAGASGASGAAGAAGAPVDEPGAGSNDSGDGGLCPVNTEYALKYFEAQKDGGLSPCTESSCAAGECCWKYKGCIAQ